jgi:hypothetical protein
MNLFGSWCKQGGKENRLFLLTDATTFCWSIWLTRNEIIFDIVNLKNFVQAWSAQLEKKKPSSNWNS